MTPYPKTRKRPKRNETGDFSRGTAENAVTRDRGRCAWCGTPLHGDRGSAFWQWQVHHRWPRGAGGTSEPFVARISNAIPLHGVCHHAIETEHRETATQLGFIIRHGARKPPEVPIKHAVHGWAFLDNDGLWTPVI